MVPKIYRDLSALGHVAAKSPVWINIKRTVTSILMTLTN